MNLEKKLIKFLRKHFKGTSLSLRKVAEMLKEEFDDLYASVVQLKNKNIIETKETHELGRSGPLDVDIHNFIPPKKNIWTHPLFLTIVAALIAGAFAIIAAVISKSSPTSPEQVINENNGVQAKTTGDGSSITNIHEQNVYLNPKETEDDKNLLLDHEQAIIKITRLLEDFDLGIQSYDKLFLKETEKITNDFISRNMGRGGQHIKVHQEHANEGKKHIEELIKNFNRSIEDVTLEYFKTNTFKTIPSLSEKMPLYDKLVNKANKLIDKFYNIAKSMEARINK